MVTFLFEATHAPFPPERFKLNLILTDKDLDLPPQGEMPRWMSKFTEQIGGFLSNWVADLYAAENDNGDGEGGGGDNLKRWAEEMEKQTGIKAVVPATDDFWDQVEFMFSESTCWFTVRGKDNAQVMFEQLHKAWIDKSGHALMSKVLNRRTAVEEKLTTLAHDKMKWKVLFQEDMKCIAEWLSKEKPNWSERAVNLWESI